ncbi:hypothetical protein EDB84DRAFT_1516323 [Lactarius hengduanensis]|nr:hypothetical protein EDB84DRAFT_1516323 [Lactarius hengduanensis]
MPVVLRSLALFTGFRTTSDSSCFHRFRQIHDHDDVVSVAIFPTFFLRIQPCYYYHPTLLRTLHPTRYKLYLCCLVLLVSLETL